MCLRLQPTREASTEIPPELVLLISGGIRVRGSSVGVYLDPQNSNLKMGLTPHNFGGDLPFLSWIFEGPGREKLPNSGPLVPFEVDPSARSQVLWTRNGKRDAPDQPQSLVPLRTSGAVAPSTPQKFNAVNLPDGSLVDLRTRRIFGLSPMSRVIAPSAPRSPLESSGVPQALEAPGGEDGSAGGRAIFLGARIRGFSVVGGVGPVAQWVASSFFLSSFFIWEGFPFKFNQPKKDAFFSYGH